MDQLDIKQNALVVKGRLSASAVWHIPVMQMFLGNRFQSNITHSISAVQPEKALRIKGKEGTEHGRNEPG